MHADPRAQNLRAEGRLSAVWKIWFKLGAAMVEGAGSPSKTREGFDAFLERDRSTIASD